MLKPSSIVGLDWRLRNLGFLEFIMVAEPYGATHTVSRWPFGKDVDWGTGDFEYNQWPFQEPNIPTKYGPIWYSTSILGSWISHWYKVHFLQALHTYVYPNKNVLINPRENSPFSLVIFRSFFVSSWTPPPRNKRTWRPIIPTCLED